MKRLLKITYPELFFHKFSGIPTKPYAVVSIVRAATQSYSSSSSSSPSSSSSSQYVWPNVVGLFAGKWTYGDSLLANDLRDKVSKLRDELVVHGGDVETFYKVLEEKGAPMFRKYRDGSAVVELLTQLHSSPQLAIEVNFLLIVEIPFEYINRSQSIYLLVWILMNAK